ncbi:MAG: hypothetical protein U0670_05250 [Anaerolineae bacterium]
MTNTITLDWILRFTRSLQTDGRLYAVVAIALMTSYAVFIAATIKKPAKRPFALLLAGVAVYFLARSDPNFEEVTMNLCTELLSGFVIVLLAQSLRMGDVVLSFVQMFVLLGLLFTINMEMIRGPLIVNLGTDFFENARVELLTGVMATALFAAISFLISPLNRRNGTTKDEPNPFLWLIALLFCFALIFALFSDPLLKQMTDRTFVSLIGCILTTFLLTSAVTADTLMYRVVTMILVVSIVLILFGVVHMPVSAAQNLSAEFSGAIIAAIIAEGDPVTHKHEIT